MLKILDLLLLKPWLLHQIYNDCLLYHSMFLHYCPSSTPTIPSWFSEKLRITKGTLKKSITFFTTRDSKDHLGLYLGPKVKGAYAKNKGGYYGAWLEWGNEVMHFGKYSSRATKFMQPAWDRNRIKMTTTAFSKAGDIAAKAIKRHETRMKKYGTLGY